MQTGYNFGMVLPDQLVGMYGIIGRGSPRPAQEREGGSQEPGSEHGCHQHRSGADNY